jgi:putative ABC transport system substrate-binding protein
MMSYGTNVTDLNRRVGRAAFFEKLVELVVEQTAKLKMVINLKSAKMLGVDVPLGLSATAGEMMRCA